MNYFTTCFLPILNQVVYTFYPKYTRLVIQAGRAMISGNDTVTEKLSAFVDFHLTKYMENNFIASFIKDTKQFLNHLLDLSTLPDNTLLVTMDIKSLYPDITHKDGVEVVKQIINRHNTDPKLTYWISCCIECILKNNNFTFNESNYIQTQGKAMETKITPKYANIFMHQLESKLMFQS